MQRLRATDDIIANFLGIERTGRRRVKRFWLSLAQIAAPYILEPLGKAFAARISGSGMDEAHLETINWQLAELHSGQQELYNKVDQQATLFKIDSERKDFQINWLTRMQDEIKTKVKLLEETVSEDAAKKARDIEDLQDMLAETKDRIKMQEEVQKKLTDEVSAIKDKLKAVNDELNDIDAEVSKINVHINITDLRVRINSLSIDFDFLLTQFEAKQKELIEVIKNANRGHLDPYIITPLNLIQMMVEVQSMLPEGTKFPFYPKIENARKLYKLIISTVYLYKNKILFMLSIPLADSKTFGLQKMSSVPVPLAGNKFAFILPKTPYMIVDKNDNEYALLSFVDFQLSCAEFENSGTYICEQLSQTSLSASTKAECEIQLFLGSKEIPKSCNKRVAALEKPVFIQLQERGAWIYATPGLEHLTFACGRKREAVSIEGSGFVRTGNCSARTSELQLLTIAKYSKPVLSSFSPRANLTDAVDVSKVEGLETSEAQKQIISPFGFDDLKVLSSDLRSIPEASKSFLYIGIVAFCVVFIIVIIFVVYKKTCVRR
ncbi:hypothetical protein NQ318_005252 [Aromia moschata]|uniref:Uncharacterized protein n=1 Tax=Aromia moschata TaxID=1265417 RepID=A0AAV8Y371_9CUCU|nr:hypothetical protein NQ318_005252 [Aromia moschata]